MVIVMETLKYNQHTTKIVKKQVIQYIYMSCEKDEPSAMAYNKTVSETIGFKTRDLEIAIFLCSQSAKVRWRK